MNKRMFRTLTITMAVTLMTGAFVGCGKSSNEAKGVKGSITLAGSTALQPLAEQAGKKFTEKNPNASINVQGGGSGTGIKLVSEGTADIGNSDILAETKIDAATAKTLVDHKVCSIGFGMVVSNDVKADNLTKAQIQDIFTGKTTNWKDITGQDMPINVINRSKASGTRGTFIDTVMDKKTEKEGLGTMQDSNGNVEKAIASNKGSISYLALSYMTDEVKKNLKAVKIDGVEANKENITAGKYPFWSYEHMYTKGEATGLVKTFLDYMVSDDNKALVEKLGYIPVSDMKVK